jgi:hypothetical protein
MPVKYLDGLLRRALRLRVVERIWSNCPLDDETIIASNHALLRLISTVLISTIGVISAFGVQSLTDSIPPSGNSYQSQQHGRFTSPGLVAIEFGPGSGHYGFSAQFSPPGNVGESTLETLDSLLAVCGTATLIDGRVIHFGLADVPARFTTRVTLESIAGNVRTFNTEILDFETEEFSVGGVALLLREAPSTASTGVTTIEGLGGGPLDGPFSIDSFFDIFFELDINNTGFISAESSVRVVLTPGLPTACPEAGATLTLLLLASGFLAAIRKLSSIR